MSIEGSDVGQRVSYEDMANPRRYGTVAEATDNQWSTYRIAWEESSETWTDGRQRGWRIENDPTGYTLRQTHPRIAEVLDCEGNRLGRVLRLDRSFRASRRYGTVEDCRRVAQGFKSVEAAAAWIAEG